MTRQPLHDHLDGRLPAEALSPADRDAARRLERAAAALRAVTAPEDLAARVMAALPDALPGADRRANPLRAAWDWLWRPRTVRVALRPAYAAGGLALAGVALALLPALPDPVAPAGGGSTLPATFASAPERTSRVYVQFRLDAPDAEAVALAGTFTGWEPRYPLAETEPGVWTALVPLEPGVHDYAFVVDGETWVADPSAPQVDDDFGGKNSRISLPPLSSAS